MMSRVDIHPDVLCQDALNFGDVEFFSFYSFLQIGRTSELFFNDHISERIINVYCKFWVPVQMLQLEFQNWWFFRAPSRNFRARFARDSGQKVIVRSMRFENLKIRSFCTHTCYLPNHFWREVSQSWHLYKWWDWIQLQHISIQSVVFRYFCCTMWCLVFSITSPSRTVERTLRLCSAAVAAAMLGPRRLRTSSVLSKDSATSIAPNRFLSGGVWFSRTIAPSTTGSSRCRFGSGTAGRRGREVHKSTSGKPRSGWRGSDQAPKACTMPARIDWSQALWRMIWWRLGLTSGWRRIYAPG